MRVRAAARIGTIIVLSAIQGCTCSSNKWTMIGRSDAPVDVDVVEEKSSEPGFGAGHGPNSGLKLLTTTKYFLRIDTKPEIKVPITCEPVKVDVSVAKSLDRVAYRCKPGGPWKFVWIASTQSFEADPIALGPKAPAAGAGGFIDANALPVLGIAAPELLIHGTDEPKAMLSEIEKIGGQSALLSLLELAVKMPPSEAPDSSSKDAWLERRKELGSAFQKPLDTALRRAIEAERPGMGPLLRATILFDTKDPALLSILEARLRELDSDMATVPLATVPRLEERWWHPMWLRLLKLLVTPRPSVAAEIACGQIARGPADLLSLLVIGATKIKCPAIKKSIEKLAAEDPCTLHLSCPGPGKVELCTPAEMDTRVQAIMRGETSTSMNSSIALIAAARATDAMPPDLTLRLERALYSIEMPKGPTCGEASVDEACYCDELANRPFEPLCKVLPGEKNGSTWYCKFEFDDAKKTVKSVKRCFNPGERCKTDADCCGVNRCGAAKTCESAAH